jgi:hypothetical protein
MEILLRVDGQEICKFEIWDHLVPSIAEAIRASLPCKTIIQHGKIVGDLLFCGVPIVAPPENSFRLQDICWNRRESAGSAEGAICFYNPRQQICMFYGDDLADEPFQISYVGEIVEGGKRLKEAGDAIWRSPGKTAEFFISGN